MFVGRERAASRPAPKLRARTPQENRTLISLPHLAWRTNGILPYSRAPVSFKRLLDGELCTDARARRARLAVRARLWLGSCLWAATRWKEVRGAACPWRGLGVVGRGEPIFPRSIVARRPAPSPYQMNRRKDVCWVV